MTPDRIDEHTDMLDVTCLPHAEPDLTWTHRDRKGHLHGYIDGELPTLKKKRIKHRNYEDGDEWTETRYHCRRCKEPIVPGTKMVDRGRQLIPGLTHVTAYITTDFPEYALGSEHPVTHIDNDRTDEYIGIVTHINHTYHGAEHVLDCRPKQPTP